MIGIVFYFEFLILIKDKINFVYLCLMIFNGVEKYVYIILFFEMGDNSDFLVIVVFKEGVLSFICEKIKLLILIIVVCLIMVLFVLWFFVLFIVVLIKILEGENLKIKWC